MKLQTLILVAPLAVLVPLFSAPPTSVRITDRVVVSDTERLGIHFGGDTFYDSVILKRRVAENFEGTVLRLHLLGGDRQPDADGFYCYGENADLSPAFIGAKAHVLSGPDLFTTARVLAIESRPNPDATKKGSTSFVKLDRPVRWSSDWMNGLLLVGDTEKRGQHPWLVDKTQRVDGKRTTTFDLNPQYTSVGNQEIVVGDTPPEVGQQASLSLNGTKDPAWVKFRVQFHRAAAYEGTWNVRLWARGRSGRPELKLAPSVPGSSVVLRPGADWEQYTARLELQPPAPGENPIFMLEVRSTGGDVLVDNIEAWKEGDGTNPTPFRDGLVSALEALRPGSMRYLRNTRDSLENSLLPRLENQSMRGSGARRDDFGAHEFYQLCAHLGANPWATLPGTFLPEEADQLMEYLAAPADVGFGRLRARLGQEQPWTRVFGKIHLQFGNEAITFFGTGYYGPDYWNALVRRIKASPYYDPQRFVLHLNEQGGGLSRLFKYHPEFDRGTINGYHVFGVYQDQIDRAGDVPGFYDWIYASAWQMWMVEEHSKNWANLVVAKQLGKEISIYEGGNYHSTFSDPKHAPMEQINRMVAGRAGGVSALHSSLILLKHWGARTQQSFSLSQEKFSPAGSFGNLPAPVRLWGGIIGMGSDRMRFRPRFLALQAANRAIFGDLVETVHAGADPKFSVTNRFGAGYGPSRTPKEMTVSGVARIHSYAFREGARRGLILVSNDPREVQRVTVEFPGGVAGGKARVCWVESPGLEDSNEFDVAPERAQVELVEREIEFRSGAEIALPPGTLLSLEWRDA